MYYLKRAFGTLVRSKSLTWNGLPSSPHHCTGISSGKSYATSLDGTTQETKLVAKEASIDGILDESPDSSPDSPPNQRNHAPNPTNQKTSSPPDPPNQKTDPATFSAPATKPVFSDISKIDSLSPRQLRSLLQDAVAAKVDHLQLWSKAASYCISNSNRIKLFDALLILQAFCQARIFDQTLFLSLSRSLIPQIPHMEPRHYVQCIDVFGKFGKFPQSLFSELFYAIERNCGQFYASEFVAIFQVLSRLQFGVTGERSEPGGQFGVTGGSTGQFEVPSGGQSEGQFGVTGGSSGQFGVTGSGLVGGERVIKGLCRALANSVSQLRYVELAKVAYFVRVLEVADRVLYEVLDRWREKEEALMGCQEVLEALKALSLTAEKWVPYEEALMANFVKITREITSQGISQLADPFDCLNFLLLRDALSKEFLLSLSEWCADAVHRPPTRSEKRPLSHQLVQLHNLIREHQVEEKHIDRAVLKFVTSKGGLQLRSPKPIATRYRRRRGYVNTRDPRTSPEEQQNPANDMEPYPAWIDKIIAHKPSTQSCGKASFKLGPRSPKHQNRPTNG